MWIITTKISKKSLITKTCQLLKIFSRYDSGLQIFNQSVNIDDEGPPIEFAFLDSGASPLLVNKIGRFIILEQ